MVKCLVTGSRGFIICGACGKHLKFMTAKHLLNHSMTMKEYRERYPYSKITSDLTRMRNSTWQKALSKERKGKGFNPWNKKARVEKKCAYCGKTYKVIETKADKSRFCSFICKQRGQAIGNRSRLGQKQTKEEKELHRKCLSVYNPMLNPATKAEMIKICMQS